MRCLLISIRVYAECRFLTTNSALMAARQGVVQAVDVVSCFGHALQDHSASTATTPVSFVDPLLPKILLNLGSEACVSVKKRVTLRWAVRVLIEWSNSRGKERMRGLVSLDYECYLAVGIQIVHIVWQASFSFGLKSCLGGSVVARRALLAFSCDRGCSLTYQPASFLCVMASHRSFHLQFLQ